MIIFKVGRKLDMTIKSIIKKARAEGKKRVIDKEANFVLYEMFRDKKITKKQFDKATIRLINLL